MSGRGYERISRAALAFSLLVTVIGTGVLALHYRSRIRFSDEGDYLAMAKNLATGHGFSIAGRATAYRAPGLPLVLAPFRLVGIPVTGLRLVEVALLAATVMMAWRLADLLAGPLAAALAAVATAVYPLQVFTATTFYPETLATALLLGTVLCAVVAARDDRFAVPLMAGAGLLLGLLVLTVPTFAVAAVVVIMWVVWGRGRGVLPAAGWMCLLLVVPITLWTVRNEITLHAFIPATTGSGYNLLLGNSEHSTPGSGVNTDISKYDAVVKARHLGEVATDRYYRSAALSYMRHHPGRTVELFAGKTLNYFAATNKLTTGSESSKTRNLVSQVTYYPLLLLLAVRLALYRRWPLSREEWLLVLLYLLAAPAMGVFVTRVRYRIPLDELLMVLDAVSVTLWFNWWRSRRDGAYAQPPANATN